MKSQPIWQLMDDVLIRFRKVAWLLFRECLRFPSLVIHADPESQHSWRVTKKGQEKDNNLHFYIRWSGLEIWTALHLNLGRVYEHSPLQRGCQKKKDKKRQQLALLYWSIGSGNLEFYSFEVVNIAERMAKV